MDDNWKMHYEYLHIKVNTIIIVGNLPDDAASPCFVHAHYGNNQGAYDDDAHLDRIRPNDGFQTTLWSKNENNLCWRCEELVTF